MKIDSTQPLHGNDETIDLVPYIVIPLRYWWILAIFACVGVIGGYLYGNAQNSVYFSSTRLFLRADGGLQDSRSFTRGRPGALADTYVEMIVVEPTLEIVSAQLGMEYDTYQLRAMINAEVEGRFIRISATAPHPDDAAAMVNIVAQTFVDTNERAKIEHFDNVARQLIVKDRVQLDNLLLIQSGVIGSVRIIEAARPISSPISPQPKRLAAIGGFLAILVGTLVSVLIHVTRDRIEQWDETFSKTGVTLLGRIPRSATKDTHSQPGTSKRDERPQGFEGFRQLIMAIRYAMDKRDFKTLLITSDLNQQGKSKMVANLGKAGVGSGIKITVIEADLQHGCLADTLALPKAKFGFYDFLRDRRLTLNDVTSRVPVGDSSYLQVVCSGQSSARFAVEMGNPRLEAILKQSADESDLVLIDCPPIMSVVDTRTMTAYADAMVLVVNERKTKVRQLRDTLRLIRLTGIYVAGMIINESVKDGIPHSDDSFYRHADSAKANISQTVIAAVGKIRQVI